MITARGGARSRGGEALRRTRTDRVGALVGGTELQPIRMRLLQVVRQDLLLLCDGRAGDPLEPVGEAFVQLGALGLRDRLVRRIAHEQVAEPERVLARKGGALGSDQFLADERQQIRRNARAPFLGDEVADGAHEELLADHGGRLEHLTLLGRQAVEPRIQQRVDRGRDGDRGEVADRDPPVVVANDEPVVDQHREHLLDEQRVALGGPHDAFGDVGWQLRRAEEVRDQIRRLVVGERLERHGGGVQLAAAPRRAHVEQIGARHAQQQDGRAARPVGDVLDQVEERGLAPVDVVEHEHERTLARRGLEEPPDRPERVLAGRRLGDAHQLRHVPADELLVLVPVEHRADLRLDDLGEVEVGQARGLLDRLDHREVRDALAVRQAPAAEHLGSVAGRRQELLDQSGLPHARGPEEREELTRVVAFRGVERLPQLRERPFAAHHRRVQATRNRGGDLADAGQAPRGYPLGLALQLEGLDRIGIDRVAQEPVRRLTQEHLARLRVLLQAGGGDVHGIARHERVPAAGIARDDLARVHADAHLDRHAAVALELLVQRRERVAHVRRGARRPERVVLVQHRDPEHRRHRHTASPMYFSTVPPCRSIAARIVSKYRDCTSRIDSGSSCSPSAVEPVTSQNTMETVLRTSRAGATGESGVEHAGQNAKSSGLSRPQFGQVTIRPRVRPTAAGRDSSCLDRPESMGEEGRECFMNQPRAARSSPPGPYPRPSSPAARSGSLTRSASAPPAFRHRCPDGSELSSSFFRFSSTIVQLSSDTAWACSDGILRSVTVSSVDPS